jgi:undecaprenyl diphosphate synthase
MLFSNLFRKPRAKLFVKPKHVVIIPDGNRRFARKNLIPYQVSYKKAKDNLKTILKICQKENIGYLTFWAFSTENWKRPLEEQKILFTLIEKTLNELSESKIPFKIKHIGRKDKLPLQIIKKLNELELKTQDNTTFTFILALDYGGQDEIIRALTKIKTKKISIDQIEKQLDTKDIPNPDLIIRTSGEKRLSGIYCWQSTYSELYFCDCYFPEFNSTEFYNALFDYQKRKRNFGK